MIEWMTIKPGVIEARVDNRVAQVWAVASRAGKYQWSAHTTPDFVPIDSDHDWYDDLNDAKADAEACIKREELDSPPGEVFLNPRLGPNPMDKEE